MKQSSIILILALIVILLPDGCKRRLDLDSMTRTISFNPEIKPYEPCGKHLHENGTVLWMYRRDHAAQHFENLECCTKPFHMRIRGPVRAFEFYITEDQKKGGTLRHCYLSKPVDDSPTAPRTVTYEEITLDDNTVERAFHLIDSLNLRNVYEITHMNLGTVDGRDESRYTHSSYTFEFSTPTDYYMQDSPECEISDKAGVEWIRKLEWFDVKLSFFILEDYFIEVQNMDKAKGKQHCY